jgi:hypothetical protein
MEDRIINYLLNEADERFCRQQNTRFPSGEYDLTVRVALAKK